MMKDLYIKAFGPVLATLRNAQLSSVEQCERLDEACSKCGRELAKWKYESLEVPLYDDPGLEDLEVDADEAEYLRSIVADKYRYSSMLIGAICASKIDNEAIEADEHPYLEWTVEEIEAEADRVAPQGKLVIDALVKKIDDAFLRFQREGVKVNGFTGDAKRQLDALQVAADGTKAEAAGAKVAAEGARTAAEKAAENSELTGRIVLNHMTPRPGDYEVKQKQLSEILEGLKAKVTVKTIQRWEKYLATNGKGGTKPPEGYTLQTRQTLAGATAWVKTYAAREKSKLNTKVSLDRLTGGRH